MILLLYYGLMAACDILIPVCTVKILLKKKLYIHKAVYIIMMLFTTFSISYLKLHFVLIQFCIYFPLVLYCHKKYTISILYFLGFFIFSYFVLINVTKIAAYYLFNGFLEIDVQTQLSTFVIQQNTAFICKAIFLIYLLYIRSQKVIDPTLLKKKYQNLQNIFFFLCIVFLFILTALATQIHAQEYVILCSFLSYTILVLMYLFQHFFISLYEHQVENQRLLLESEKTKFTIMTLIKEQKQQEELKKFKHDIQNNFIIMKHMMHENQYEDAYQYLNSYMDYFNEVTKFLSFNNLVCSAIINDKMKTYSTITFHVQCFLPQYVKMNDIDFATILGNLLDNACEYMQRKTLTEKIEIKLCSYHDTDLFIEISNPCLEESITENTLKTNKRENNHGYGLRNIQSVINRYDGIFTLKIDNKKFIAQVLIPEGGIPNDTSHTKEEI